MNKCVCSRSLDVFRIRCRWVNLRAHCDANVAKRVDVMLTKLISRIILTVDGETVSGTSRSGKVLVG